MVQAVFGGTGLKDLNPALRRARHIAWARGRVLESGVQVRLIICGAAPTVFKIRICKLRYGVVEALDDDGSAKVVAPIRSTAINDFLKSFIFSSNL
jgi:hypothetical protein